MTLDEAVDYMKKHVSAAKFLLAAGRENGGMEGFITTAEQEVLDELEDDTEQGEIRL